MKTVVSTKLLIATIIVAIFMIFSYSCVDKKVKEQTHEMSMAFESLMPGDLFDATIWNKPDQGFTLLLSKKIEGEIEYELTIDDYDPLVTNHTYQILLDDNNYIKLIKLIK